MKTEELAYRFAANVRRYRKQRKMTQVVLAAKAETDSRYIQNIESGNRTPGVVIAYRIAQALDVTLDSLFESES